MKEKNKLISWKQISKRIKQKKKEMESDKRYKKKVIKVPYQFFFFENFGVLLLLFPPSPFLWLCFAYLVPMKDIFRLPLGKKVKRMIFLSAVPEPRDASSKRWGIALLRQGLSG